MVYLHLFYEFFKTGLFAVGGGLATLPFLYDIASRYDWLSAESLPDMIAVSESTPGPIGINMATYAGFHAAGILGAITATCALILPSIIIIVLIAKFLAKFNENKLVQSSFSGLRPAVTGLIAAAGWQVFKVSLFALERFSASGVLSELFHWKAILLFVILILLIRKFKWHPLAYIAGAAVAGVVFRF